MPSVEEAIEMAEQRFDECSQNPCGAYHTLADAQEALANLKCELCPAQFWASGNGYDAYMYQIIEIGSGDGYGFAKWTVDGLCEGGKKMNRNLKCYISEIYDTGFLTPEINFVLAVAAYVLAALGFIFGA